MLISISIHEDNKVAFEAFKVKCKATGTNVSNEFNKFVKRSIFDSEYSEMVCLNSDIQKLQKSLTGRFNRVVKDHETLLGMTQKYDKTIDGQINNNSLHDIGGGKLYIYSELIKAGWNKEQIDSLSN